MSFSIALASGIAVAAALAALFASLVTLETIVAAMLTALDRGWIISLPAISSKETKRLFGKCILVKLNFDSNSVS
jgi:hypothetical protein